MSETKVRTWTKSTTWRIWGIIMSSSIAYALTEDLSVSFWFMFWTNLSGFVCFYIHERVWGNVKWGVVAETVTHQVVRKSNPIHKRAR